MSCPSISSSIGEGKVVDYRRVAEVSGAAADSPASTQIAVMGRVHDVLTDLHKALAVVQPSTAAPVGKPDDKPTGGTFQFTLRD